MRSKRKPPFAFMDLLQGKEVDEELHRKKQHIEKNRLRERAAIAAKKVSYTFKPGEIVQLSTGKFETVNSPPYAELGLLNVRNGRKHVFVDEVEPTGLKAYTFYEVLNHEVYDHLQIEGFASGSDNRLRIRLFNKDETDTIASITLERLWELLGSREELRPF